MDNEELRKKLEAAVTQPDTVVRTPEWRQPKCTYWDCDTFTCHELSTWTWRGFNGKDQFACDLHVEWAKHSYLYRHTDFIQIGGD